MGISEADRALLLMGQNGIETFRDWALAFAEATIGEVPVHYRRIVQDGLSVEHGLEVKLLNPGDGRIHDEQRRLRQECQCIGLNRYLVCHGSVTRDAYDFLPEQ